MFALQWLILLCCVKSNFYPLVSHTIENLDKRAWFLAFLKNKWSVILQIFRKWLYMVTSRNNDQSGSEKRSDWKRAETPCGCFLHSTLLICDWILENRSKSHIRSFEINSFKDLKPLQLTKGSKHEYENYTRDASIYHLSDNLKNFWLLSKFPAK